MFNFLGEGGYAETIVKFIYKGEAPGPGPVPPGPVPPGPTPTPTPGGGGGSSWLTSQTGDGLMWIIGALIVVASICLAVFMYRNFKKTKANASLGQVFNNGALASRFILTSNFAKICLAVLISCVALFACFGVAFANVDKSSLGSADSSFISDVAYAEEEEETEYLNLEVPKTLEVWVYDEVAPVVQDDNFIIKNADKADGIFSDLVLTADESVVCNWTISMDDGKVLYNQPANKENNIDFAETIKSGDSLKLSLTTNIDIATALSLCDKDVLKIKYIADTNTILSPTEEDTSGILEKAFLLETGHDCTFASSVSFKLGPKEQWPAEGTYRAKADISRSHNGAIMAFMVNDEGEAGGYHIEVWSEQKILCAPNSCSRMFQNFRGLEYFDFTNLDTSTCNDFSYMFYNCGRSDGLAPKITIPENFEMAKGAKLDSMFEGCLTSIDVSNLDTETYEVSSMNKMFKDYAYLATADAQKLLSITLTNDENGFVIPRDCTVADMFNNCNIDISTPDSEGVSVLTQLDTSKQNNFARMFAGYQYIPVKEEDPENKDAVKPVLDVTVLDVSHAEDMTEMFYFVYGLKATTNEDATVIFSKEDESEYRFFPGSDLTVTSVNMTGFFKYSNIHNLDLSNINFSKVTSMDSFLEGYGNRYYRPEGYQGVEVIWPEKGDFVTASECSAERFYASTDIKVDVWEYWDASKITSMNQMFLNYGTGIINEFINENKTVSFPENYKAREDCDCRYMFEFARADVDLSNWDASNILRLDGMFKLFGFVSQGDKNDAISKYKIKWAADNEEGAKFTPKEGASFAEMFYTVQLVEIDLSQVDLNKVSNFSHMFEGYGLNYNLKDRDIPIFFPGKITWPSGDIKPAKPSQDNSLGANMSYMFASYRVVGESNCLDLSNWKTENVNEFEGMFAYFNGVPLLGGGSRGVNVKFPESGLETADKANLSSVFKNASVCTETKDGKEGIVLSKCFNFSKVTNISHMFEYAYQQDPKKEKEMGAYIDASGIDVSKVTDMSYMFSNAFTYDSNSQRLPGIITLFNNVAPENEDAITVDASHFFDGCNVKEIDLGTMNFANIDNISYFLANYGRPECHGYIKKLPSLFSGGAKLKNVAGLFYNSYFDVEGQEELKLDLTTVDASNFVDMSYMFYGFKPKKLDISTWNPSSCINMEGMFMRFGQDPLTDSAVTSLVLPSGDTKWTTGDNCSMKYMFAMCLVRNIDLSNFVVSKVTNMEGMFMAAGTSVEQIQAMLKNLINMLLSYLPFPIPIPKTQAELLEDVLDGNADQIIDALGTSVTKEYRDQLSEGISTIDQLTEVYQAAATTSASIVSAPHLNNFTDKISLDDAGFSYSEANAIGADLGMTNYTSSKAYENLLGGYFDNVSSNYLSDIKSALNDVLASNNLKELLQIVKDHGNNEVTSQSNIMAPPIKVTFPSGETDSWNPGAAYEGEQKVSMKAMFALFNFMADLGVQTNGGLQDYVPSFDKFDTQYVYDMGYMFAGFMFSISGKPDDAITKIDVSSFNTANVGPKDSSLFADPEAEVGSMQMMFALTGNDIAVQREDDPETIDHFIQTEFDFGDNFVLGQQCDTSFMFLFTRAKELDLTEFNVANKISFDYMFALCNAQKLDLSTWGSATNVVSTQYMFAFYGAIGELAESITGYEMDLGVSDSKFKLWYYTDASMTTTKDTDTKGMFICPMFSVLDLKNVDVSGRTSLSRLFEFTIMPNSANIEAEANGLDISTWDTSKVNDFSYMFAVNFIAGLALPEKLQTATGNINVDYMFLLSHTVNYDHSSSTGKQTFSGIDLSDMDLSSVSSLKGMFMAYCAFFPTTIVSSHTTVDLFIKLGTQTLNKCIDMSYMFMMASGDIDISGITTNSVRNTDFMFAFSGFNPVDRIWTLRQESVKDNNRVMGEFFSGIKLPATADSITFGTQATSKFMFLGTLAGDMTKIVTKTKYSLTPQDIDFSCFNTTNVTSMKGMFMLSSISVDFDGIHTDALVDAKLMFAGYGLGCLWNWLMQNDRMEKQSYLPTLTFPSATKTEPGFKLKGNCDVSYMFSLFMERPGATSAYFDLNNIDVSELNNFDSMFALGLGVWNFDISKWNWSKAVRLDRMFFGYGLLMGIFNATESIADAGFYGPQIKFPEAFPTTTITASGVKRTATWMFAFSTIVTADENGDVTGLDFDMSKWSFAGLDDASYMFAGYGAHFGHFNGFSKNFSKILQSIAEVLEKVFENEFEGGDAVLKLGENDNDKRIRWVPNLVFKGEAKSVKFKDGADLTGMFAFCEASVKLSGLDVSNVSSCNSMFAGYAPSNSSQYSTWTKESSESEEKEKEIEIKNTIKINLTLPNNLSFGSNCNIRQMFMMYFGDTLDVSGFDVSKVKDFTRMFALSLPYVIDVSKWNTALCENCEGMFAACLVGNVDLTKWTFTNVKNMNYMFLGFGNKGGSGMVYFPETTPAKTAKGCTATGMFMLSSFRSILLYGLDASNFGNVDYMFSGCANLERINVASNTDWTYYPLSGTYMFYGCYNLVGQQNTQCNGYKTNIDFARVDGLNGPGYFTCAAALDEPYMTKDPAQIDSIFVTSSEGKSRFTKEKLSKVKTVEFINAKPPTVSDTVKDVGTVPGAIVASLENENSLLKIYSEYTIYSQENSCIHMFKDFTSLNNVLTLASSHTDGYANFDTIGSTSMQGMFDGCVNLLHLDLNTFRMNNVTDVSYMFENVGKSLTDNNTTITFTNEDDDFYLNCATTAEGMFMGSKIWNLNLKHVYFNKLTNYKRMFYQFNGNTVILPDDTNGFRNNLDTGCDFSEMFSEMGTNTKSIDIASLYVGDADKIDSMFANSKSLVSIYANPIYYGNYGGWSREAWRKAMVDDKQPPFVGCVSLHGHNWTVYDAQYDKYDKQYMMAKLDSYYDNHGLPSGESDIGYFSSMTYLKESTFDSSSKPISILNNGDISVNKAKEIKFTYRYNIDYKYVMGSPIDVSLNQDGSILEYKMSYTPNASDSAPYYIVVDSNHGIFPSGNSFAGMCMNAEFLDNVDLSNMSRSNVQIVDTSYMFNNCSALKTFDASNILSNSWALANASYMFRDCKKLKSVNLGDSVFGDYVSDVNLEGMFYNCQNLETIHVGNEEYSLNDSRYKNQSNFMFAGCKNLRGYNKGIVYTYNEALITAEIEKDLNYTFATVPKVVNSVEEPTTVPGLFTYGAVLASDDGNSLGIIYDALSNYRGDLEAINPIYQDYWYIYYNITKVVFATNFVRSTRYNESLDKNALLMDPRVKKGEPQRPLAIDMSGLHSEGIPDGALAYIIKNGGGESEAETFEFVISTNSEHPSTIIAQEGSLKYMFSDMRGLESVSFSRDANYESNQSETTQLLDTSCCLSAYAMFRNTGRNAVAPDYDLSQLDTSSVIDFGGMFESCRASSVELGPSINNEFSLDKLFVSEEESKGFTFESARDVSYMFDSFGRVNVDLSSNGFRLVTNSLISFPENTTFAEGCNAKCMFQGCRVQHLDLSRVNFSNVVDFTEMFAYSWGADVQVSIGGGGERKLSENEEVMYNLALASENADFATFEQLLEQAIKDGNVPIIEKEYEDAHFSFGISIGFSPEQTWGPNTPNYNVSMNSMFECCMTHKLDLSHFSTVGVTDMRQMFKFTPLLNEISITNKSFDTSKVTNFNQMFMYCGSIRGFTKFEDSTTPEDVVDFPVFAFREGANVTQMFQCALLPVNLDEEHCIAADNSGYGLNMIKDFSLMFCDYAYYALPALTLPTPAGGQVTIGHPERLTLTFATPSSNETTYPWKLHPNTSMYEMFRECKANVDLTGIDAITTTNVTDYIGTFMSFGNEDVTWLGYKQVGIKLPEYLSSSTNASMSAMFKGYKGYVGEAEKKTNEDPEPEPAPGDSFATILGKLKTLNVVDMSEMFCGIKVKQLDFSETNAATNFDTAKVRNMYYMFGSQLLRESYVEKITLSDKFKIDSAVDLSYMFGSVGDYNMALRTIVCGADWASTLEKKVASNHIYTDNMFYACINLVGVAGTEKVLYSVDHVDHSWARPAAVDSSGKLTYGYFTAPKTPEKANSTNDELKTDTNKLEQNEIAKNDQKNIKPKVEEDVKVESEASVEPELQDDSIVELENPLSGIDIELDNKIETGKLVVMTFFQSIFNGLTKIMLSLM